MDGITPIALWIYAQENHQVGPGSCKDRAVLRQGWLAGVLVFAWPAVTLAGPPLIADDPNTLGSGQLQVSPALAATGGYGEVSVSGPILDLSLGLLPGVDLSLFGTPLFVLVPGAPFDIDGLISLGLKLRPFHTAHFSAAFSPYFDATIDDEVRVDPRTGIELDNAVGLPVQIEFNWSRWFVGADAGYVVGLSGGGGSGYLYPYVGFAASPSLTVVAELVGLTGRADDVFIGANAGVDWASPKRVHLLASGGVALESRGRTAPVWRAFVGLSWEFTLWSTDFGL